MRFHLGHRQGEIVPAGRTGRQGLVGLVRMADLGIEREGGERYDARHEHGRAAVPDAGCRSRGRRALRSGKKTTTEFRPDTVGIGPGEEPAIDIGVEFSELLAVECGIGRALGPGHRNTGVAPWPDEGPDGTEHGSRGHQSKGDPNHGMLLAVPHRGGNANHRWTVKRSHASCRRHHGIPCPFRSAAGRRNRSYG